MTEHRFTDAATIKGARKTQDGYLIAEAFVARSGVQLYRGAEMGLADRDVVRVWRPQDEVMQPSSVRGYSHTPITMNHPTEFVTADNWAALAKGEVSTEAEWKDGRLRLPLIVKDADAIAAIEGGTRELSAGYMCRVEMQDGVTPEGEAYDAVQKDIRINHLAIVPKGRAGAECRIGDAADTWGAAPITMSDKKEDPMSDALKTVVLGDKAVKVALSDEAIIEAFKADAAKRLTDAEADHAKAIAAKDAELAQKDGKIADLEGKVLTDADLDKRVQDRAALIDSARKIAPKIEVAGLSDAAIRRKAIEAVRGADAMKDKSDAYVDASFDIALDAATKGTDTFRAAAADGAPAPVADGDYGQTAYQKRVSDAWKSTPAAKEA